MFLKADLSSASVLDGVGELWPRMTPESVKDDGAGQDVAAADPPALGIHQSGRGGLAVELNPALKQ